MTTRRYEGRVERGARDTEVACDVRLPGGRTLLIHRDDCGGALPEHGAVVAFRFAGSRRLVDVEVQRPVRRFR